MYVKWHWDKEETLGFHKMGALLCTLYNLQIYGATEETRLADTDVIEFCKSYERHLILTTSGQLEMGLA